MIFKLLLESKEWCSTKIDAFEKIFNTNINETIILQFHNSSLYYDIIPSVNI